MILATHDPVNETALKHRAAWRLTLRQCAAATRFCPGLRACPLWRYEFCMMEKHTAPAFPATRMRRNRKSDWSRRLVSENALSVNDLLWPLFLIEGEGKRETVPTMPGVERLSVDEAVAAAQEAASYGIPVIALF
ncbi:MAG: hypothetical protein ABJ325_00040, partial [Nitratireductor sp.]